MSGVAALGLVRRRLAHGAWVRSLGFLGVIVALVHLVCFQTSDPLGTLSGFDAKHHRGHTDHVAHVGETRIFPRLGWDLWRIPAATMFRRLTPSEIAKPRPT